MTTQSLHRPGEPAWTLGLLALCVPTALVTIWVASADPGRDGSCDPGLAWLPFAATDPTNLSNCLAAPSFPDFIARDWLLIAMYVATELVALCWVRRCLKGYEWPEGRLRHLLGWGAALILAGAAADVTENALLLSSDVNTRLLIASSSIKLILVLPAWILTVLVLAAALWRFTFPWTSPPVTRRLKVPDGDPSGAKLPVEPWNCDCADPSAHKWTQPRYGIGLSGGGIRSAAFASGAIRVLGADSDPLRPGWQLDQADYLATVSGGGYIGCSMQILDRAQIRDGQDVVPRSVPPWYADRAPETDFLYLKDEAPQGHRYLGEGRALAWRAAALALSVAINIALAGLILLCAGAVLGWLVGRLDRWSGEPSWAVGGHVGWLVAAVALAVVGGLIWQLNQAEYGRTGGEDSGPAVRRRIGAILVIAALVLAVARVDYSPWAWAVVLVLAGSGLVLSRRRSPATGDRLAIASRMMFSGAWLVVAWIVMVIGSTIEASWSIWIPTIVVLTFFFTLMDQTWVSPHPFYKWRLASTFALERRSGQTPGAGPVDFGTFTHLDEWASPVRTTSAPDAEPRSRPELLICAAAAVEDVSIKPHGTRAVPFVFRHDRVGSPELGEMSVGEFRHALDRKLASDGTMQAAMAISAAAVASNVGVQGRLPTVGTALALLNLRLGVWLPNPRFKGKRSAGPWSRRRAGIWFLRELTGVLPADRRYVYVSDGGHLDNLGLLELIRRRCRTILLVDASGDRARSTATFDASLQLAQDLFHVVVEDGSRTEGITEAAAAGLGLPPGASRDSVDVVHLVYPAEGCRPEARATVVLAKAVFSAASAQDPQQQEAIRLRDSEPQRGFRWRARAGSVPTTSTLHQSLTDDAYSAYVLLGQAVARRALHTLDDQTHRPATGPTPADGRPERGTDDREVLSI